MNKSYFHNDSKYDSKLEEATPNPAQCVSDGGVTVAQLRGGPEGSTGFHLLLCPQSFSPLLKLRILHKLQPAAPSGFLLCDWYICTRFKWVSSRLGCLPWLICTDFFFMRPSLSSLPPYTATAISSHPIFQVSSRSGLASAS